MKSNLELAESFLSHQNFIMAREMYGKALREDAEVEGLFGLALCAYQEGDTVTCLKSLNELLEKQPGHAGAFNLSGMVAATNGDLEGAEKLFVTAIRNNPELVEAQRNYGEVLIAKEDYENGVKVLDAILKKHPDDIPTLLTMAELSMEAEMMKEALLYLNQVIDLDPENESALEMIEKIESSISEI